MNETLQSLIPISLILVVAWLSPGPNMLAVISASVSSGRRAGFATGFGVASGNIIWAAAAVAGLAGLFEIFPKLLYLLRFLGCVYLLWLAFLSMRSAMRAEIMDQNAVKPPHPRARPFQTGLVVILTNPKAVLFFASIFTTLVPTDASLGLKISVVALSGLIPATGHMLTSIIFSRNTMIRVYNTFKRKVSFLFAVVFAGLAAKILCDLYREVSRT